MQPLRCKLLGHVWTGTAKVSSEDGRTMRYCKRCKQLICLFPGWTAINRRW